MRIEDDYCVWPVKPAANQPPQIWQRQLRHVGLRGAQVSSVSDDRSGNAEIIEVCIKRNRKGVELTHEQLADIEGKIRSNVGEILQ
ncbi:MAG: hypothetical protein WCX61_04210 [Candidatus Peribacteraceae bacterium]|jgi:hypothetical protein